MKVIPGQKLNMDFPSKNYKKYRSQTKTNPFLNNLNQDAGYPQDVLVNTISINDKQQKNYLEDNMKNLKNFFSDRLPPKEAQIFKQSFTIDPAKLFQIKKKQHQLKSLTRSKLDEKLDTTMSSGRFNHNKISQIFQFNDKNEDFKKKLFSANQSIRITQPYQRYNHLRGTTSFIKKYSNLVKKNAYNSVFGPDPSATKRHSVTARLNNRQNSSFSRPFTTDQIHKKKFNLNSNSKKLQRKKFSSLIQKIDKHRQSLDPQNKRSMRSYIPPPQQQDNQANKNYMITWIKDTTKIYKYNSIDAHAQRIRDIEDIQKIDKQFYEQMKQHKARRLQHRQSLVQNIEANNTRNKGGLSSRNNNWLDRHNTNRSKGENDLSISLHDQDQYSISSQQQSEQEQIQPQRRRTGASLLGKFIRCLVDAIQQARFFGIKQKDNIYKAFWQQSEPYEKSGSYAFFKAIKRNDLQGVTKFIQTDPDFMYQIDHKGRSPLIYAVQNNHSEIVSHMLGCDININKACYKRKTALYFAIKNQNVLIVKKLLLAGAIPWSAKKCSYKNALQKVKNPQILTLIKNARKIAILIKMYQKKPQQVAAWNSLKQKITEQAIISFQ